MLTFDGFVAPKPVRFLKERFNNNRYFSFQFLCRLLLFLASSNFVFFYLLSSTYHFAFFVVDKNTKFAHVVVIVVFVRECMNALEKRNRQLLSLPLLPLTGVTCFGRC